MTTLLLTLLVLIELARLVLQYRSGKTYCTTSEVENVLELIERKDLQRKIKIWGHLGFEVSSVIDNGDKDCLVFFTKKNIKNFSE